MALKPTMYPGVKPLHERYTPKLFEFQYPDHFPNCRVVPNRFDASRKSNYPEPKYIADGEDLTYQARNRYFGPPAPSRILPIGYSQRPHPSSQSHRAPAAYPHQYNHLTGYSYCGQWDVDYYFTAARNYELVQDLYPHHYHTVTATTASPAVSLPSRPVSEKHEKRRRHCRHHHDKYQSKELDFVKKITDNATDTAASQIRYARGSIATVTSSSTSARLDRAVSRRLDRRAEAVKAVGYASIDPHSNRLSPEIHDRRISNRRSNSVLRHNSIGPEVHGRKRPSSSATSAKKHHVTD